MPSERDLRIVILSFNTRELLASCLQSLLQDPDSARWHVVVVDNASGDGSPQMVRERFPDVTLIENPSNRGFAAGNNVGCVGAQEPVLFFLNSDTVVPAGAIGGLLRFLAEHPGAVAVGPRLVSPDGSVQMSCGGFPGPVNTLLSGLWLDRLFPRSRFFGRPNMTWLDHTQTVQVQYLQGAALMVRREAFEAVGGWPEEFFFYAEDADLCRQLQARGGEMWFHGAVSITHIGGASAKKASEWATLEAHRSVLLFALRSGGPGRLLLQRLTTILVTLPRLVGAALALGPAAAVGKGSALWRALRVYAKVLALLVRPLKLHEAARGAADRT
jgi:GT2 family glycosyltransferase